MSENDKKAEQSAQGEAPPKKEVDNKKGKKDPKEEELVSVFLRIIQC